MTFAVVRAFPEKQSFWVCAEEGRLEKELAHMVRETGKSTVFRVCQQAEDSGRVNAVVQIQRPSRLHPREDGSEFSPDLGLIEQGTIIREDQVGA